MLRTGLLTGTAPFDDLREAWRELAFVSPGTTPFQTVEWHATWWRHYGQGRKPVFVTVHEGDDLVGLMPFVKSYGMWRSVRPMGIGPSDYLHPLAREGYGQAVAEAIHEALAQLKGIDLIDLHQVRETQWLAAHAPPAPIEQAMCLVLDLPESYDAYLAMLGKSLRYDVRKLDKTLFSSGRAVIERYGAENARDGLEVLFDLHRARWRKRHLPGAFVGRALSFHRDWARQAAKNGWLWLSVLRVDGEAIGAIYAMAFGSTVYFYQAGFDPSNGAVSPGTLLVASTIRRAIEEGNRHFDFMRGDEPYKRRWKPQRELRNLRFLCPGPGIGGRAGAAWNMLESRIEGRLRAKLEGHGT